MKKNILITFYILNPIITKIIKSKIPKYYLFKKTINITSKIKSLKKNKLKIKNLFNNSIINLNSITYK